MKNINLFIVLLFSILLFGSCTNTKSNKKSSANLKLLTYNIHHANPPSKQNFIDLPAIAKVIMESKADVVGLQELDVNTKRSGKQINQAAELAKLSGMHYYFAKAINYDGGEYGIAILSRFPIIKSEKLVLPMKDGIGGEPRVMAAITIEPVKGKKIIFANTHLDLKPENRLLQANAIVDYLGNKKLDIIFCGDFNTTPESEIIKKFETYFTRSSIPNGVSFPNINPDREIDYIMYKTTSSLKIVNHKIINETYASDHLPVLVEFVLE